MTSQYTGTSELSAFFKRQTELLGASIIAAPAALSVSAPVAGVKAPEQP